MTLAQMQARFFELKGKLAVGQIQEEEFKRELEKLRFQDAHGRWWMIGAQSGRWYYYDGARWLLGDPPEPPPPALGAGEQVSVNSPNNSSRPATYTQSQTAAATDSNLSGQTISATYSYAPAQTTPVRTVEAPVVNASPAAAPAYTTPNNGNNGTNGNGTAYAAPAAAAVVTAASEEQSHHSLGDTLHQELGKVRLPHVQAPHIERPHMQAPNIHIPPQFLPHAPGQGRQAQPPYILIGAVVVGVLLLALLFLAADNLAPGKPISTFFGRALGGTTAGTSRTPNPRSTPVVTGQNVDNLLRVGDDLARKSQFEPAIAQYQAAAKYSPNDAEVYTHWARALALTGRISEAITTAQKATKLDPTSASAFAELTRALAWAGQTQPAINAGEKAVGLDPQNATAQAFLAEAYLHAGQNSQAQDAVDKALELDDSNPDTHRAAGWVAILSGRKDEGVGEWNRVIELAPDVFLYRYEFGLVFADHLNDPQSAIPSFQQAIQLYPPYIPSYTALGRAYLAASQPGPAILVFQKALTLDPNSSDAFLGLGQAFETSQKCPQAIPYYQKALELNKDLGDASKGLEDCGAIAKGSAPIQAPTVVLAVAPLATAIPDATVAPLAGTTANNQGSAGATSVASPAAAGSGGGRIYFPIYDGQYHLYSANTDGSDRKIVKELASSPAVSPDGTHILYYSWVSDQRGIHRMDADGGGDMHISLRAEDNMPSWSPDGGKYVYSTRAGTGGDITKRAYTIHVSSSGSKPRQDPPALIEQAQAPAWGPNNQIAFRDCGFPTDVCGLAVVNQDGSGKTTLTNINSTAPAWSPDGNTIVFMSNAAGNWDLYTVSANGGSPERLTDNPGDDGLPVYSPDGKKVAFVTNRDGKWSVWEIDPNGDNEQKLFDLNGELAGTVSGNSAAQPGQVWTEQRIGWK